MRSLFDEGEIAERTATGNTAGAGFDCLVSRVGQDVPRCVYCRAPLQGRLNTSRKYCDDTCQRRMFRLRRSRRQQQQTDLDQLFACWRHRLHERWRVGQQRINKRIAELDAWSNTYTIEQRGYTYGGCATAERFQVQED